MLLITSADARQTTLDPGLRRDDRFGANSTSNVIPAQAGIQ
jgi:hypothetical protein